MDAIAADVIYMYHWCCYNLFTDSGVLKSWKLQRRKYAQLLSEVESLVLTSKKKLSTCLCYVLFALLADLGINNEEYQMEKVKQHFQKWFGDASTE